MPEPIEFQIVQDLQRALQAIAVGDGYHYDVRGTAVKLNPDYDVEALVEEGAPRPWVTLDIQSSGDWTFQPAMRVKRAMPIRVHWFNEVDQVNDDEMLGMCYRAYADIEQAAAGDERRLTRGGLAIDTRIVERAALIQGSSVWVAVDLSISLIRVYGASA